MNFNFGWKKLSEKEVQQLTEWDKSPDPSQRLFTEYYTWSRWQLLDVYFDAIGTEGDFEQKDDAWESLENTLSKLREDYVRDLKLFFEMQQTVMNSFSPLRLKLQFTEE